MRAQSLLTFATALVAASIGASAAQAQELTRAVQRVELHGDAPAACVANGGRAANPVNASFQSTGPNSGTVLLPLFVDTATATTRGSSIEVAVPVICNTSHTITVRSANGGLLREGAAAARTGSGGFSEFQAYDVGLQWQQQVMRLGGATSSATLVYAQPAKGDLIVNITVPRGTAPLVAGTYSDSVVVEIRPAN